MCIRDSIWGVAFDESLGNSVKITILAAGFDVSVREKPGTQNVIFAPKTQEKDPAKRLGDEYGTEKVDSMRRIKEVNRYIILSPEQFDDDTAVEALEQMPAYNRDRKVVDELKAARHDNAAPTAATSVEQPSSPAATVQNDSPASVNNGKSIDFLMD